MEKIKTSFCYPDELHPHLVAEAKKDGRSLRMYITMLISDHAHSLIGNKRSK